MKKKTVEYVLDTQSPKPLTAEQKAELKKLMAMPEGEIDFSDIPPLDERFFKNAVRGGLYRPVKASTTVRVDADVLLWLKSKGKGYQTRINAILRQAMQDEMHKSAHAK